MKQSDKIPDLPQIIPAAGTFYSVLKEVKSKLDTNKKPIFYHIWLDCLFNHNVTYEDVCNELSTSLPSFSRKYIKSALNIDQILILGKKSRGSGKLNPGGSCYLVLHNLTQHMHLDELEEDIFKSKVHMIKVDAIPTYLTKNPTTLLVFTDAYHQKISKNFNIASMKKFCDSIFSYQILKAEQGSTAKQLKDNSQNAPSNNNGNDTNQPKLAVNLGGHIPKQATIQQQAAIPFPMSVLPQQMNTLSTGNIKLATPPGLFSMSTMLKPVPYGRQPAPYEQEANSTRNTMLQGSLTKIIPTERLIEEPNTSHAKQITDIQADQVIKDESIDHASNSTENPMYIDSDAESSSEINPTTTNQLTTDSQVEYPQQLKSESRVQIIEMPNRGRVITESDESTGWSVDLKLSEPDFSSALGDFVPVSKQTIDNALALLSKLENEDRVILFIIDECFTSLNIDLIKVKYEPFIGRLKNNLVFIMSSQTSLLDFEISEANAQIKALGRGFIIGPKGSRNDKYFAPKMKSRGLFCGEVTPESIIIALQKGKLLMVKGAIQHASRSSSAKRSNTSSQESNSNDQQTKGLDENALREVRKLASDVELQDKLSYRQVASKAPLVQSSNTSRSTSSNNLELNSEQELNENQQLSRKMKRLLRAQSNAEAKKEAESNARKRAERKAFFVKLREKQAAERAKEEAKVKAKEKADQKAKQKADQKAKEKAKDKAKEKEKEKAKKKAKEESKLAAAKVVKPVKVKQEKPEKPAKPIKVPKQEAPLGNKQTGTKPAASLKAENVPEQTKETDASARRRRRRGKANKASE